MKMRKITSLLMAVALMAATAACGDKPAASGSPAADGSTAAPSQSQTAAAGEVTLEFFSLKPETAGVMEEIVADFNKENPNIKVVVTSVADSGTVLQTRIATNEIPDIMNVFPAEEKYKAMFRDGLMMDLTDKPFIKNVSDKMLAMTDLDGKQFSLPMTLSSYGIYYRTDIFEKEGLKEPTTYAELVEVCKALDAKGYDAFAMPNKDVGNIAQRLERTIGVLNNDSNTEFKKIAAGEMKVEDSKTIRSFAEMCTEIVKYSTDDHLGLDYESAVADLVNGKAAMMYSGTWMLSTMQKSNPDIAIKLIPIPSPISDKLMVPVNVDTSFSISSTTKHPEEALKFLEYLSRTEVAQKYYSVDGNVNMINGVAFDKSQHSYMKELMDKGDMFLTQVNFWPNGLREEMRPAAQQLYVDNNVDAFVKAFGEAINKLYNK